MTLKEQIKNKAEIYFNYFAFNGYYLDKNYKEVQRDFAFIAIDLLLIEIDDFDFIKRGFWEEVKKEIEKIAEI